MKFIYFPLIIIILPLISKAQISDLPNIGRFIQFETHDTLPTDRFRADGSPHVLYTEENGVLIRKEYYKYGGLKSQCDIVQKLKQDTSVITDYDTRVSKIATFHAWLDRPIGEYVEYYESWVDQRIKSIGLCKDGRRIGEWVLYDMRGNKTEANFDFDEGLKGKYTEFYFDSVDSTYSLKLEGQLGLIKYKITKSKNPDRILTTNTSETRRIGLWKYYATDGTLLEVAEYKWKLD